MPSLKELLSAEFGADFEDISGALPKHASLRYTQRPLSEVPFIVLHHTDAARAVTWASVAAYHVNDPDHQWPGIGYHIGVRDVGGRCVVNLLNPPELRSYHAHIEGNKGIAVCVAGKFGVDIPSTAERNTLQRIVAVARRWATWRQSLPVLGHGQVPGNQTDCPGEHLKALLPALNKQADLDTVIFQVAKANQVIRPNPSSAISILMRNQGYTQIGNEADVRVDDVWYGVTQLGYYPGGGEVAFFATNTSGEWTVRMVEG
jgi:hypothetical protein